jgi:hypothetical protein
LLYLCHHLQNPLFFPKDIIDQLLGRHVLKVLPGVGVVDVQVAVVSQKLHDGHAPGALALLAIIPPGDAVGKSSYCSGFVLV